MMKHKVISMTKELLSGIFIISGVALAIVGAEVAAPLVAGVGAAVSLGAGVVQAIYSPRRKSDAAHERMTTGHF